MRTYVCLYVYVSIFSLALSTKWAKKQKSHSSKGMPSAQTLVSKIAFPSQRDQCSLEKSSWPLNKTGLNCAGSLTQTFLSLNVY